MVYTSRISFFQSLFWLKGSGEGGIEKIIGRLFESLEIFGFGRRRGEGGIMEFVILG